MYRKQWNGNVVECKFGCTDCNMDLKIRGSDLRRGKRFLTFTKHPKRKWGLPVGLLIGVKAARTWGLPLASIWCRGWEWVELYLPPPYTSIACAKNTLPLDPLVHRGLWSNSDTGHFSLWENALSTLRTGGWVDPRVGLDPSGKRQISAVCRQSNHDSSIFQLVVYSLTDCPTPNRNVQCHVENCP